MLGQSCPKTLLGYSRPYICVCCSRHSQYSPLHRLSDSRAVRRPIVLMYELGDALAARALPMLPYIYLSVSKGCCFCLVTKAFVMLLSESLMG